MTCEPSLRTELLDLLSTVGERFGLSRREIDHLLWLIRHSRILDWEPGNRAVVYKSVSETAAERGVSPRQIYNYEQAIAGAFGLSVLVSFNRRRYGRRDPDTGRIVAAFGFELTGLREALPALRRVKAEIEAEHERRRHLKRRLAGLRGQVRKLADAVFRMGSLDEIEHARAILEAVRGRVTETTALPDIEQRIAASGQAQAELEALLLHGKSSGLDVDISDTYILQPIIPRMINHRCVVQRWTESAVARGDEGAPVQCAARRAPAPFASRTRLERSFPPSTAISVRRC